MGHRTNQMDDDHADIRKAPTQAGGVFRSTTLVEHWPNIWRSAAGQSSLRASSVYRFVVLDIP
jgi:hypothetical protein